jgi:class 3 adenylate cyclase
MVNVVRQISVQRRNVMAELPTGTVTFLFTDIEGSTALAQQYPAELPALLARHHAILYEAVAAQRGYVFRIIADAFCAAFHTTPEALSSALQAPLGLEGGAWNPAPVKVRMGLHTAAAEGIRKVINSTINGIELVEYQKEVAVLRAAMDAPHSKRLGLKEAR